MLSLGVSVAAALHVSAGRYGFSANSRLAAAPYTVTMLDPATIDPAAIDPSILAGAAAVFFGGAAVAFKGGSPSKGDAPPSPTAPEPTVAKPVTTQTEWLAVGGTAGPHRMAGTMPRTPPRELWIPPPGWRKPSKPVRSWYDSGKRLRAVESWYDSGERLTPPVSEAAPSPPPPTGPKPASAIFDEMFKSFTGFFEQQKGSAAAPPEAAPAVQTWPTMGGSAGPHRMAGTMPAPPPRELWEPPPGWLPPKPPSKVNSWYDSGIRL